MDFSEIFKNPLVQQYLLAAGAGMMNQPTFGHAVGSGIRTGSAAALESLRDSQEAALAEKQRQQQLQDALVNQKALYEYKKQMDEAQSTKQQEQINSAVDAFGLSGKDADMLKFVARWDPSAISSVLTKNLTGEQLQLKNDQVNGGFVIFNPKTGGVMPANTEGVSYSNAASPVSTTNNGKVQLRNLFDVQDMSPKTRQAHQEAQVKADVENQAKQKIAAQEFLANDQYYDSLKQQTLDSLKQMETHVKGDEDFRKNDWVWGNLPDNSIVNGIRSNVTEDKNMALLKRDINSQLFDRVIQMVQAGGSSKLVDTNSDVERLRSTIMDPSAPHEAKLEAIQSLREKAVLADQQYQTKRKFNYELLGLETPQSNSKPKNNILSVPTNGKAIGATGMMNGKRIRVVGTNQIEVLD